MQKIYEKQQLFILRFKWLPPKEKWNHSKLGPIFFRALVNVGEIPLTAEGASSKIIIALLQILSRKIRVFSIHFLWNGNKFTDERIETTSPDQQRRQRLRIRVITIWTQVFKNVVRKIWFESMINFIKIPILELQLQATGTSKNF